MRSNVTGRLGAPNRPGGVTAAAMATEVMLPAAARSSGETGGGVRGDIAKLGCVEGTTRGTRNGSRDGTSGWSPFQLAAGCDACVKPAVGTTGTQRGGRAAPASAAVVGTPSGRIEGSAAFLRNAPTRRGGGARPAAAHADCGSGAGCGAGAVCGAGAGARAVPHELESHRRSSSLSRRALQPASRPPPRHVTARRSVLPHPSFSTLCTVHNHSDPQRLPHWSLTTPPPLPPTLSQLPPLAAPSPRSHEHDRRVQLLRSKWKAKLTNSLTLQRGAKPSARHCSATARRGQNKAEHVPRGTQGPPELEDGRRRPLSQAAAVYAARLLSESALRSVLYLVCTPVQHRSATRLSKYRHTAILLVRTVQCLLTQPCNEQLGLHLVTSKMPV